MSLYDPEVVTKCTKMQQELTKIKNAIDANIVANEKTIASQIMIPAEKIYKEIEARVKVLIEEQKASGAPLCQYADTTNRSKLYFDGYIVDYTAVKEKAEKAQQNWNDDFENKCKIQRGELPYVRGGDGFQYVQEGPVKK
jgi:flagellar hook assembly protein FlgD